MQKKAPTVGNLVVIVLFVLSCFGLLMFLWESFGGPLPLKPKGYRFTVAFPRTLLLAEQSDVRISGVNVGHVISLKLGKDGRTHATVEVAGQYAPIRSDMHAILRQKTLLGETFVQLIPESRTASYLPDQGQLPNSQVEPSVTLDDILASFDAKTRRAWQVWFQSIAVGLYGRGEQVNASFAQLEPFVEHANQLVTILASQEGAVRGLVHNTGVVFDALAGRDHQLEGLIANGERTFHAAAASSQAFANAFRELPAFEHNSTVALQELDKFSVIANPYLDEFVPAEEQLSLLLNATKPFAPPFNQFLTALGPLTKAAKTGLPAFSKSLRLTTPILENVRPVLHNLDPFLQSVGQYVPELQAFFANLTAASQAQAGNSDIQLRQRPQAASADDDGRAEPREPRHVSEQDRHRPRQRLPAARHLPLAGRRAPRLQQQQLRQLGSVGERAAERNGDRRSHPADPGIQSRQQAGLAQPGGGPAVHSSRAPSRSTATRASSRTPSTKANDERRLRVPLRRARPQR